MPAKRSRQTRRLAERRVGRCRGRGAGGIGGRNDRRRLTSASRRGTAQAGARRTHRGPDRQSSNESAGRQSEGGNGARAALPDAGRRVGQDTAGGPQVVDDHGTDRGARTGSAPGRASLPTLGIAGRPVRGDCLELVQHVARKLRAEPEEPLRRAARARNPAASCLGPLSFA